MGHAATPSLTHPPKSPDQTVYLTVDDGNKPIETKLGQGPYPLVLEQTLEALLTHYT
jgi:hypothetical protein